MVKLLRDTIWNKISSLIEGITGDGRRSHRRPFFIEAKDSMEKRNKHVAYSN